MVEYSFYHYKLAPSLNKSASSFSLWKGTILMIIIRANSGSARCGSSILGASVDLVVVAYAKVCPRP